MALTGQELLDYACVQFENGVYDAALEAFILAYTKGYEREWVLENIYNCYMAGNESEFRKSYEAWEIPGDSVEYDNCLLDFIPYRDGEYYIFDKEIKEFRGLFSIDTVKKAERPEEFIKAEFSAIAVYTGFNLGSRPALVAEAAYRKAYIVCPDIRRCASFFKLPEMKEYAKNIMVFSSTELFQLYFHRNTAVYLPKLFIGDENEKQKLIDIANEEHEYRLTPEGRNTSNVLLTIGIPTHDRGNLLLKRLENLMQMPYDAEVEFAVSKNGMTLFQEEYRQVSEMTDARINYEGHDKELGMSGNWQNVVKISHGKFVMLVSDEDDVVIPALEHYLHLLSIHEGLGAVRPRTVCQYYNSVRDSTYYECGISAFLGGLFWNNYLSGTIYNREMFLRMGIEYYDEHYGDNEFYQPYPHLWWQILMAFEGDFATDAVICIKEGDSVMQQERERYKEAGNAQAADYETENAELGVVSTYDSRISQFRGGVELLQGLDKINDDIRLRALYCLGNKTVYLMKLVYEDYHYQVNEFPAKVQELVDEVLMVMERWGMERETKKAILQSMQNFMPKQMPGDEIFQGVEY